MEAHITTSPTSKASLAESATSSGCARLDPAAPDTPPVPVAHSIAKTVKSKSTRPVFVLGCPRSGTTVLYHMILSSGDFAGYPFESDTFRLLGPKFPGLSSLKNLKRLLEYWWRSSNGVQSGIERRDIESRVHRECRNIGDFLRIVMEEMCRKQGVRRWVEKTPDHLLSIPEIKRPIPDCLIVHTIREGRDAALSLANFGRIQPYFCQLGSKLLSFAVYWKWLVRRAGQVDRRLSAIIMNRIMKTSWNNLARL